MCDIRYKVLWVDDLTGTQDEIFATGFESVADEKGIDLIPFTNWEEAELELKKNFRSYSAIILDANCKYGKMIVRPMNFLSHRLYRLWHVCLVRKDKLYLGIYFLLVQ